MSEIRPIPALIILLFLYLIAPATATAADNSCLNCHGEKGIADQGSQLYIDPAKYAITTHAHIGCSSCHERVSELHPSDGIRPSRATCQECHGPVFSEYSASLHSGMAACVDCHNPHAVKSFVSISGRDVNTKCYKCHDSRGIIKSHSNWLPQTALHMDEMPCITCHTGSENYVIAMYLAKRESTTFLSDFSMAGYEDLSRLFPPGVEVKDLLDPNNDGLISLGELKKFNAGGQSKNLRLLGIMMPEVITHNYQILDNRWDCTFCHASGPKALQTSYLTLPQKDGTYSRIPVERGAILDVLYGTPDFYMLGTTRSATLSIIGAVIASFGLAVPFVHGTIRFMTRNRRKEH